MKKNNISIIFGIVIMLIGSLLPSIRIASENINFIKENGILIILLIIGMLILLKLKKKEYIYIPATISLVIIVRFIVQNIKRLRQINELYNCYAAYQYGIAVLLIGNLLTIIFLTLSLIDKQAILEKIKSKKVYNETTEDGKIKFNKMIVKVDNNVKRKKESKLINFFKLKITKLMFRKRNKKLSITRFRDDDLGLDEEFVPVIDISKWTRSEVCCLNCGATVSTNSDYCFLCDSKITLNKKEKEV